MAEPVPIWPGPETAPSLSDYSALERLAHDLLSEIDASGVAIAHESDGRMVCIVSCGRVAPPQGAVVDVNSGITGRCLRESRPLHCYDTELDPRVDKDVCRRLGIRSLAIAPFHSGAKAIGFAQAFSDRPGAFDPIQMAKLETLAQRAAGILLGDQSTSEPASAPLLQTASEQLLSAEMEEPVEEQTAITQPKNNEESAPRFLTGAAPARSSRGIARTFTWVALVLVGSVAALSLPRLVHRRTEQRMITATSAAVPSLTQPPSAEGVSVRPADAVEVQRPASESLQQISQEARAGDSFAQLQLAGEYASGKALPKDLVKAAVWYIMSANSGNQSAKDAAVQITRQLRPFEIAQVRFNVGKLFADGIGTEKNSVSAYLWFALAEAAGDVRAKAEEGKLAEMMTVAEINDAQTRASTWLSGHRHQATAALHQPK